MGVFPFGVWGPGILGKNFEQPIGGLGGVFWGPIFRFLGTFVNKIPKLKTLYLRTGFFFFHFYSPVTTGVKVGFKLGGFFLIFLSPRGRVWVWGPLLGKKGETIFFWGNLGFPFPKKKFILLLENRGGMVFPPKSM